MKDKRSFSMDLAPQGEGWVTEDVTPEIRGVSVAFSMEVAPQGEVQVIENITVMEVV